MDNAITVNAVSTIIQINLEITDKTNFLNINYLILPNKNDKKIQQEFNWFQNQLIKIKI